MPETRFKIQWPDGSQATCYSPSSIVKKYFELERDYDLGDFVDRAQTALNIASDRVRAKYGRPCGLAIGQLAEIQAKAAEFKSQSRPIVRVIDFIE
ncbi:MSMEG_0570 family nitrogen starvation response protein [Chamaesiphon minutus]|uniref:MSMEG_0570 family protein n=1 Tax=Chamaesiphon minutus (strain ATCC 27169 / PCC 6605) TaxID=1173020 RepID=K9UF52_CHAP6|nr:MSMEG_0570 family nitrogen starvation response protein [Chamaesiphon minutus]AFY93455.1 MSMEG_0570 family protein [Chamaesiphon minutus PCC 6605]